jgi:hypothetical protein
MPQRLKWLLPASAALVAIFILPACHREREAAPAEHKAAPPSKPAKPPPTPIRDDSLDRQAMILASLHALTNAALGHPDADTQRDLRGRKFSVRIRFGCPGATDPDRSWSYDDKKKVLRVKVRSTLSDGAIPASDLLAKEYQGMVGFALGKPWLLGAGCPVSGFDAVAPSEPVIVIAQLFTKGDSRVQRPQRDYGLTKQVEPEEQPTQGLDLVISGRLAELADGRPIHCAAAQGAPACILSARIDRVAVENPVSGDLLGEWGSGVGVSRAD